MKKVVFVEPASTHLHVHSRFIIPPSSRPTRASPCVCFPDALFDANPKRMMELLRGIIAKRLTPERC